MSGARAVDRPLRIVRVAGFGAPVPGGLLTALRELGAGYRAAGHEPVLVLPGSYTSDERTVQGRVITLPAPPLPGTGGHRVLTGRHRLARLLEDLEPDRLEVCDRAAPHWTGTWARRAGVPSVAVAYGSVAGALGAGGLPHPAAVRIADAVNRRTARAFERIVCTSGPAAEELTRIGAVGVVRASLGVDLTFRHPARRSASLRGRYVRDGEPLLLLCSRLSAGKRPGLALDALAELRRRGVPARLLVAGDGPLRDRLERRARDGRLPAAFLGHQRGSELASCQASADAVLSPGRAETFGLAALEALACGTPVVASGLSALPDLVGAAGESAADDAASFADAVERTLSRPEEERRAAARARAEGFGWPAAVDAFLAAHEAPPRTRRPSVREGR